VKALKTLVDWRRDRQSGRYRMGGVILAGRTGQGKTALATYLAFYGAYLAGLRSSYVSCQAMLRHLRGSVDSREMQYADYLRKVEPATWQAVTLDDLGAEAPAPGASNTEARDAARDVIDICSSACMYLVITTNKTPEELARYLTDRWASRASELTWVQLGSTVPDIRKELR
jgi:DNA replication protein DnaC